MLILQIAATITSCGLFVLFVTYDGLNNSTSPTALFFSIAHIVACLPMTLTIIQLTTAKHYVQASFMTVGLAVYASMA